MLSFSVDQTFYLHDLLLFANKATDLVRFVVTLPHTKTAGYQVQLYRFITVYSFQNHLV